MKQLKNKYTQYKSMSLPAGKNPFIWFDAADAATISKSGNNVTGWGNKGTSGGTATIYTANKPTSGVVSYNGRNLVSYGTSTASQITNITLPSSNILAFIVMKATTVGDYVGFFNNYEFQGLNWLYTGSDTIMWGGPNGVGTNVDGYFGGIGGSKPILAAWINQTGGNTIRRNGTAISLINNQNLAYNTSAARTYVTNNYTSSAQDIGEMIIYGTTLTSAEIIGIEGYLAWKWGIQGDLPAGHTYKPVAVSVNAPSYSAGAVSLSWTAGIYTSFKVYRDTQVSGATKTTLTTTSSTSYSDSSVSPGTTYYYFVEGAIQDTFSGIMSTAQSVTTTSVPSQPAAPTISSVGSQQVTIGWVAPNNGGSAITGYTITIYNIDASTSTTTSAAAGDTSKTITGLTNGVTYKFAITATNAIGNSTISAQSAAAVPANVPSKPAAPTLSAIGNQTVTVNWIAPPNGGAAISGYTITIYNVTASTSSTTSAAGGATSKVVSGLTNGSSYRFTVIATNTMGNSLESDQSATAVPFTSPGVPTAVSATPASLCAIVSWTKPSNNGSTITSYTIKAITGGSTVSTRVVDGEDTTSGYIYDLANGTAYTFTVAATNVAGTSADSLPSSAVTPVADAVTNAVEDSISTGSPVPIQNYIAAAPTTTDNEKADVTIDMRVALNAANANTTTQEKVDSRLAYIDSMRSKVGADTYMVPQNKFTEFIQTLITTVPDTITPKPIDVFVPAYNQSTTTATVDVSTVSTDNYVHIEIPIGYSIILQNGAQSLTLTYDGTSLSDGSTTYTAGSSIVLGNKTFTLLGIGSITLNQSLTSEVICVVEGSLIATPVGNVPVETLRQGDKVLTGDGRVHPISKIYKVAVVCATTVNAPYIIEKDAFHPNCPPTEMQVSPRHAILLNSPAGAQPHVWELPCEAAKCNPRVYQNKDAVGNKVVYYHFALHDYKYDTVFVNGQLTETLNDGKYLESYVWNTEHGGYLRTYKEFDKKQLYY